jgi:hypothetical protein
MNGHQHQSVDSKLHLIQLREQARIAYCAAYHQVNGDFVKHPSLRYARRRFQNLCARVGHCAVYRDSLVAYNNSTHTSWVHPAPAIEVYKCRLCGATYPVSRVNSDFKGLAGVSQ